MMWTLLFRRDSFVACLAIAILVFSELAHATCPPRNQKLENMTGSIRMTNDNPSRQRCSWRIVQDQNRFLVLTMKISKVQCSKGFEIAGVDYCHKTAPFTLVFHEKCWQPCNESNNCRNTTYPVQIRYRDVEASKGFELTYGFERCNKTIESTAVPPETPFMRTGIPGNAFPMPTQVNSNDTTHSGYCELGIKSGKILDSAMSASSEYSKRHAAHLGRLDNKWSSSSTGSWSPKSNDTAPWIQVDLGTAVQVVGVITQGRPKEYDEWVTSYRVSCGITVNNLAFVTENRSKKNFTGNVDKDSKAVNYFMSSLSCRFMRIYPLTYHNHSSMRIGLIGSCNGSATVATMTKHSVAVATYSLSSPHGTVYEKSTVSTVKKHGKDVSAATNFKNTRVTDGGANAGTASSGKHGSVTTNANRGNTAGGATGGATIPGKHGTNASDSTTRSTNSTSSGNTTVLVFAPSAVSATPILLGVLIPLSIVLIIFLIVMVVLIRKQNPPAAPEESIPL